VIAPETSAPTVAVPTDRALAYLKWCPVVIWAVCAGGMWMGWLVARADELRSAKFTLLGGLPGWPVVWGVTLMTLGALSVTGRFAGARGQRILTVGSRSIRLDGNAVTALAMWGMSFWYAVFAASLILGTAAYGYAPYLTLAATHFFLGLLVYEAQGVRLPRSSVPRG
jgi:hypothetical protein